MALALRFGFETDPITVASLPLATASAVSVVPSVQLSGITTADMEIAVAAASAPGIAFDGVFPQEYSLFRPLLANNPGALIAGDDWQDMVQTSDLNGHGFVLQPGGDASLVDVVNGAGKRAEIVADPVFVRSVRCWITDGSDTNAWTVRFGSGNSAFDKVWHRILMKFQQGFDGHNDGTSAKAHKMVFSGMQRVMTFANTNQLLGGEEFHSDIGGTKALLPGGPVHGGPYFNAVIDDLEPMYGPDGNEQWYRLVIFEERLSPTHYRRRMWFHRASTNDVLEPAPIQIFRNSGIPVKLGNEWTGASVPAGGSGHLQMGINRNAPLPANETMWWQWGPYEIIDAAVVPDPYGLAVDML